MIIPISQQTS